MTVPLEPPAGAARPFAPFVVRDAAGREHGRFQDFDLAVTLFLTLPRDGGKAIVDERLPA
jgi:hypothetical protein